MAHRYRVHAAVAAVLCALASAVTATAAPPDPMQRWSGAAAIDALGARLPAVAARHGLAASELARRLRADRTLWLDSTDALLYVDRPVGEHTDTVASGSAPLAAASGDAFALHSRPGARRVVYLDFDGHLLADTAWSTNTGGDCTAEPFDADGSAGFSSSELAVVRSAWQRVAEDYAPFDVDVTTEDPGVDAINRSTTSDTTFGTRVVITRSVKPCPNGKTLYRSVCPNGCGGVAYVGVFDAVGVHSYYQPALVFANGVGTAAKHVAEATAHETGHTLGLAHDGTTSGCGTNGTSPCSYYAGQGSWAPIMGLAYYEAITQFSKGEYPDASNTEDDFAVAQANGAPLVVDDHGDTPATATMISGGGQAGTVATREDVDAFTITLAAGPVRIDATPAPTSPDLDIRLKLRDASGVLLMVDDPDAGSMGDDSATGLAASISAMLPAGTYTISVEGVGEGSPLAGGYSGYASVGDYALVVTTGPTVTTFDVVALSVTGTRAKSYGFATARVGVADASGAPVEGVTATGDWYVGSRYVSTKSSITATDGIATTTARPKVHLGDRVTFCVRALTRTGDVWDTSLYAPSTATDCATWTVM